MKYKAHHKIGDFEFIEAEYDTLVDVKTEYDNIKKIWSGEKIEGMKKNEWSAFKKKLFIENTYDLEDEDKLSPLQKWFRHEVENTLQQIKNQE